MEEDGELNWDIEPHNGKNCFFSREAYEMYSLAPTLAELVLLSNKPTAAEPEPSTSSSGAQDDIVSKSQEPAVPIPMKNIQPFPEPRVPYPRYSCLTGLEQETYVKLMIKFINSTKTNINALQMKEYNHYEFLKTALSSEHMEFQKFLQNAARSCPEDYNVLCADAARYIPDMIKSCQDYVKNYPEFYAVHAITSMLGGKFIPDLSLNMEKCLLKMGRARFVKVKFPTEDILLPTSYDKISQAIPPVKKAGQLHKNVTSDANISKLVSKYRPQVVLTAQALFTLLNNHGPEYSEQWEIPVRVETVSDGGTSSKVVYVDSPLPKKVLSTREKSQMFHEVVLDQFMKKNSFVPLKAVCLDIKEEEWLADNVFAHREPVCGITEVDFENDVTELETFGSSEAHKSDTAQSNDTAPELSQTLNNSLLDGPSLEKKLIIKSDPVKSDVESEAMEEELKMPKSSTAAIKMQSFVSNESETDSDEEKLVIDYKKSTEDLNTTAVSEAITTSPPAAVSHPFSKKTFKKISKDVDPLGQILKMQTQLLKPGCRKTEQASIVSSEKIEQLPQNPVHIPPAASLIPDSQETQRKETTIPPKDTKKSLLSKDLLILKEDDTMYTMEKYENLVYRLFSLDDILLLLQSTVHTVLTARKRAVDNVSKKQIPIFVLTKMDYQYCYGVESLTESESCRLWTESLLHSKCALYVGHVDALTSKFFMLEEVTAAKLKEKISIFNPANCLNTLRHILKWLTNLQDGSYLLSHASKDVSIYLYKSVTDPRGNYNLHKTHSNPPKDPSSLSVPWVPLNPNLLLNYHIQHGRPPCTFPPEPARKAVKSKIHQPKTSSSHKQATDLPSSNVMKPKQRQMKGRNRLQRLKAKQKKLKAQAQAQAAKQAHT